MFYQLKKIVLLAIVSSFCSWSMEAPKEPVKFQERLKLIKELSEWKPGYSKATEFSYNEGGKLIWDLYHADKAFIFQEIQKRTNKKEIEEALDCIDSLIKIEWKDGISMEKYSIIGYLWAHILTSSPECIDKEQDFTMNAITVKPEEYMLCTNVDYIKELISKGSQEGIGDGF